MKDALFYVKKIRDSKKEKSYDYSIIFEGREFPLRGVIDKLDEISIGTKGNLSSDDVVRMIDAIIQAVDGVDCPDNAERLLHMMRCHRTDDDENTIAQKIIQIINAERAETIAIRDLVQFRFLFGDYTAKEVTKLLCDVYNGRYWYARIVDVYGSESIIHSYISDDFIPKITGLLKKTERFWMELRTGSTKFNPDWIVAVENEVVLFDNIHDGLRPIGPLKAQSIINSVIPLNIFVDKESFTGTVMKSGNSFVIKVTEPCRRMGIGIGDEVMVSLEMNTPDDNLELSIFAARNWTPITSPSELCHHGGCDMKLVRKFLGDFRIIGTVEPHYFTESCGDSYRFLFDHVDYLKKRDGDNIVVAQPRYSDEIIRLAKEWSRKNGCEVEEYRDYSWNSPPETTLLVFKKRKNPDWRIPAIRDKN